MSEQQPQKVLPVVVTPSDMVCLILDADKIILPGYQAKNMISPWRQQIFRVVQADAPDGVLMGEFRQQAKKNRWVGLLAALCIAAGLAFVGGAYYMTKRPVQFPLAPIQWSVQTIKEGGLELETLVGKVGVPIGAQMPNGEVLISTSRHENSYTTNKGTTRLAALAK
jgi:hypothetical protein